MRAIFKSAIIRLLALVLAASAAFAQERSTFRQEELDQMLAPIALYPDSLLSQVLMASTYPLEVVQAARWSRSQPHLRGQDAVQAVEPMNWDPSVKSLVAFPQILSMMAERLDWTERLGEAFLAHQAQVMDTVQSLRRKAAAAGHLRSGDRARVTEQGPTIIIEPANPQVVYVPYYDPTVIYGPWWWPAYPPVYWGPPPGYYVHPAFAPGFAWGSGITIAAGFFFGHFDWPHRHVKVVHVHKVDHSKAAGGDARRDLHRHDAASPARHGDERRRADFRGSRSEERREAVARREERVTAPNHAVRQGNDRRSDSRREITPPRAQPQPAVIGPAAHPGTRPTGAVANSNERALQPAVSNRGHRAETRHISDRRPTNHQGTTIRDVALAPRPSATSGNPVSRMGSGNHSGDGGAKSHGGGTNRQQSRAAGRPS